ncbi:uncharacterized mitochondrial protein AtMg00810-like [Schistocerca americana]|uniref:uncharacterized mitochondrial protein AtMg00810-like n=1 Tax=Schistocerca americana TaxID=7009 RepID=UPI001F4F3950|nr:uncharacterized mitochondrial protein AtMg00810-like [Schistocerca americana]
MKITLCSGQINSILEWGEAEEEEEVSSAGSDRDQDPHYIPDAQSVADTEETEVQLIDPDASEEDQPVRRSAYLPKPKEYPNYVIYLVNDFSILGEDPVNLEDATSRSDKEDWIMAMKEEIKCFQNNGVWELVDPPKSNKSIVGKKWVFKLEKNMDDLGYVANTNEGCAFIKWSGKNVAILALYVDDFYVLCHNSVMKDKLYQGLSENFEVKDLGEAKSCMGMCITRNWEEGSLKLDQNGYIADVLKSFDMVNCAPVRIAMEAGLKLWDMQGDKVPVPYQELIGCLLYISTNTRPDISYAAIVFSQYNCKFTSVHWKAAKMVLRYLKGTTDYGIAFDKGDFKDLNITSFVDSNFVDDLTTGLSQHGSVFILGKNIISWKSKKLKDVTTSTTEAKYAALNSAAK